MKIIEAMKMLKQHAVKVSDLQDKIAQHCALLDTETPMYGENQAAQIAEWLQSVRDTVQEIARLRVAIQHTNMVTNVTIELGGQQVTKTIAEWIHWRRELATMMMHTVMKLSNRGLREGTVKSPTTGELTLVKIRYFFDPRKRDEAIELWRSEPSKIDSTLEIVNAVTNLMI